MAGRFFRNPAAWDLTALLNAADPKAALPARNLWLARLLEWLRHAPTSREDARAAGATALPLLRLKHLLNVLDRHPEHQAAVRGVIARCWSELNAIGLFADVGFAPRMALWGEVFHRFRLRLLPGTVDTSELGELFAQLFPEATDEAWLRQIDAPLLARLQALVFPQDDDGGWRAPMRDALTVLVSSVRAAGLSGPLRLRMGADTLAGHPFEQLARASEQFVQALDGPDETALRQALQVLRALLDQCRSAVQSVPEHLEAYGVSVDIIFDVEQLTERLRRIEDLLDCLVAPDPAPRLLQLTADLVRVTHERRSLRTLFARHYSLLARKVAERSAETGEHYITRDRDEYRSMLRRAAGGGAVIAGTVFAKFAVMALGLSAFWAGFWAGANYALSFVIIHLLHWTVATKQPAMTAPAMAHKLSQIGTDEGLDGFVDEVAHLVRSQVAGILGNLAVVAPLVLLVQGAAVLLAGAPLVGEKDAHYTLHSLNVLGPSWLYAAFTGVLLFISSLIAGWAENWFVFHRLDSAIAWNPRIVARLGPTRAQAWAAWWRANVSGMAANISLGLMLGLVPALLQFLGLPIEVRHVTLSTGQLAAAVGALGPGVALTAPFWLCVLGIAGTGVLNLVVSFALAFRVALRSRGIQLADRARVRRAIWHRLRRSPGSFLSPPAGPAGR
ncbi:site-specific recombinase [Roseateles flavus]|uniref:Site-specific recombinase n=1 Tax=Roseateles flavus TaxID=3149041 RepID=A0ABV0G958_9BURK